MQGSGSDASAGYHGYWITDFTQIDPHLGTNADMKTLIAAAHAKGMKVYFDIITNHTADVISYDGGKYTYVPKATTPYKDASGNAFDDAAVAGKPACTGGATAPDCFPAMSAATSFPYVPKVADADKDVKVPAWLNDTTLYHNRGDSTYAGESSTYGDFSGLDDLFTENPKVVSGMEDIYKSWVDFGVDGFRIDTVKHVNMQFWQSFSPAILDHAKATGKDELLHVRRGLRRQPRLHEPVHDEGQAAGDPRLRLPGRGARLRPGQGDDRHPRPLRRRRLLHRHRLQRLRAADLPRQPRHGPRRRDAPRRRRHGRRPARPRPSSPRR